MPIHRRTGRRTGLQARSSRRRGTPAHSFTTRRAGLQARCKLLASVKSDQLTIPPPSPSQRDASPTRNAPRSPRAYFRFSLDQMRAPTPLLYSAASPPNNEDGEYVVLIYLRKNKNLRWTSQRYLKTFVEIRRTTSPRANHHARCLSWGSTAGWVFFDLLGV
jgi:hypothetical protein